MGSFWFLISASWRNRWKAQLKRVRSPRYAIALVVGILYIWYFLFRPTGTQDAATVLLGRPSETIITLLVVLTTMGTWLFGSDLLALAFTPAEVSFLFPAPLSRRSLIAYKLVRAQIAVLINSLIWVFILRRGGHALPSPLRALALWTMFSTLNLHRLAAALVRTSLSEHRSAGARRSTISIAAFAAVVATLVAAALMAAPRFLAAEGVGGFFAVLNDVLVTRPASIALYPFHLILAPTFARSAGEWLRAMGPAVVMLLLHAWWVLTSDAAFEEAAVAASAERARRMEVLRQRRTGGAVKAPSTSGLTLRLASTGRPSAAIIWKNTLCLVRTAQLRLFISPLVMGIIMGFAFSGSSVRREPARFVVTSALILLALLLLLGGRMIRNDLRHDMLNLPLLKSLPVRGADLVLAEVASAMLPLAGAQTLLLVVAFVASQFASDQDLSGALRVAILVGGPFALVAINAALLTIYNGIAVLFPTWIRLGPTVSGGVEALGQNALSFVASIITLAIGLIVPLICGGIVYTVLNHQPALALAASLVAGSALLAAETYGVVLALGRAYERAEPLALV